MKRFLLLAVSILTLQAQQLDVVVPTTNGNTVVLDTKIPTHPCKVVAEGGAIKGKMLEAGIMFSALLKYDFPLAIIAMFFPFVLELSDWELARAREQAATMNFSQKQLLTVAKFLNNGWNLIGAGLATYVGHALYYRTYEGDTSLVSTKVITENPNLVITSKPTTNKPTKSDFLYMTETHQLKTLRNMLIAYIASQAVAIGCARKARNVPALPF